MAIKALRLKYRISEEEIEYRRNVLLFGDDSYAVMITGTYTESSGMETEIENSLLTAVYHKTLKVDPQEGLKFDVSPESEGFTFINSFSGVLTYSMTDSAKQTLPDRTTFVVSSAINRDPIGNFRQHAIDKFQRISVGNRYSIATLDSINIDGVHGFEITGYDKNKQFLAYEVILYPTADDYNLLTGKAGGEIQLFLEKFHRIARTFKRK